MNLKKISFILAVLLVAVVALGSVAAAEDIADDVTAISDDDSIEADLDSAEADLGSVDDVVESVPEEVSDEVVLEDVEEIEETRDITYTNHQVDANNWSSFDFEQGNVIVDFEPGTYTDFSAKVGNYTILNGNGAVLNGNGNSKTIIFDITNTTGVTINGFTINVNNQNKSDGIAGSYVYDANISNNTISNGEDGINIYRSWNNIVINGNAISNMSRDGISLANPDSTYYDYFPMFTGATITNNQISDLQTVTNNNTYGIFIGGTFKGDIKYNTIDGADYGIEFAGKPNATYGKLSTTLERNNISNVDVGVNVCHPDVIVLRFYVNNITANNYSINTNDYFSKNENGHIDLYYNVLNGEMATDFINNINWATGNTGTDAYNNGTGLNSFSDFKAKNSLGDSILSESTDSNQFKNSGFDEGLNDWILYNQDPLHPDVLAYLKTDGQQGNCLFVPWDSSVAFQFISQENINYTSISGIRFKAKNNSMGPVEIKLFDDNGENCLYTLSISSSQSWVEYEIPSTAFESLTDNLFHKFILRVSVSFAMDTSNEGCWLDDFETIPAAAPSQTETTLIVVEDGNNLAVTFKDVDGNAVAGDVKVYNGEELIGTLTFDGGNTTKTIAKPSVAGGSTVTITAKFEGNEAYAASTSEPISYVAPYNADDIQELFDNVEEGGVINLVAGAIYDVGSTQFTLTKKVTVNGNGATIIASGAAQGGQGAVIIAKVAGTAFKDIIFKNSDGHKEYGEGVAGYAIELAIENGTVDNCMFLDWSSGIYGRGAAFCNITNCYFNGSSDLVTGAGKGEKGTKAINLMGSHDITVKECTFEGQVLDGISIASNSGHNIMTDNTFIDNVYAIYFGGASTQGCVIANNTFIRCGYCPNVTDDINKKVTILSTQKACNGFIIADNFIEALSGTTFISMESGNTAHGYPSTIGDINVTGNTLALAEGAVAQTITFVKIVSNEGELSPYAPINISGNDLADGVTPVKVWYADWGSEDNPVIPAADPVVTSIEIVDVSTATKKLTVKLVDIGGEALAGETITYSINGAEAKIAETDEDGLVTIDVTENGVVAIAFEGNDQYKSAETSINFAATAQRTETQIIYQNMTTTAVDTKSDGRIGKYFIITLKDSTGKAIANKPVQIGFNGVVYDRVTDENGQAKLQINLKAEGVYTFAVAFLGDDQYNGSFVVAKITVSKQKGSLTVPAKSYAASAATKTLTATFKSAKGNPVAGKKVTFTVNGKTYSATTNAKGVATVKVSLNKKGTYSFTAKFAGDNTYAAISKSAKLTIK